MRPLREPVLHFALGALVILGAERASRRRQPAQTRPRIEVPRAIDAADVAEFVRDEALAREALARRLGDGDAVIRRRLAQKMTFVIEADATPPEPTDDDLQRWLDAHADELRRTPRVSFAQVFFSRDRRGEAGGRDAREALASMARDEGVERAVQRGDPHARGSVFPDMRFADVTDALGYDIARALDDLPAGAWHGPFESAAGWHLIRATSRTPGGAPGLTEARAEARRRWTQERREALVREAIQRVVRRYEVVR